MMETGGGAGEPPDVEWPDLLDWALWGRVRMHRVPHRYYDRHSVGRLSLSLGHCGRMCRPPFSNWGHEVTWCETCFPNGEPRVRGTIEDPNA